MNRFVDNVTACICRLAIVRGLRYMIQHAAAKILIQDDELVLTSSYQHVKDRACSGKQV